MWLKERGRGGSLGPVLISFILGAGKRIDGPQALAETGTQRVQVLHTVQDPLAPQVLHEFPGVGLLAHCILVELLQWEDNLTE